MCQLQSIRLIRRQLDISLNRLAQLAGIAPSSLSRLELGIGSTHHETHIRQLLNRIKHDRDARSGHTLIQSGRHATAD